MASILRTFSRPLLQRSIYISFAPRFHRLLLDDHYKAQKSLPTSQHPESVIQWLDSISESESYRERHCRSDTLLRHWDDDLILRPLTKSAPNMEYRQDADGFTLPPTPISTGSRSDRAEAADNSQVSQKCSVPAARTALVGLGGVG
jgi:hypothetical protein